MNKLIFFSFFILFANSCAQVGQVELDLIKAESKFTLQSKRYMTTDALIQIDGYTDCPVKISISGVNTISLDTGKVSYERWYEWYSQPKKIRVQSEGCSEESNLTLKYKFIRGLL